MRSPVAAFLQILIPGNGIKRVSGCFEYLFHFDAVRDEVNALGYPKKTALCDWLNEDLQNNQRKWSCKRSGTLVRCSQEQKEMAVKEYCSGEKAPTQIASEYGICPNTVYRWRDTLLSNKNMKEEPAANSLPQTIPELQDEVSRLTKEAEELKKQVYKLQLERDILEKAAEIIKKGAGISPESLSNREKAELIDALRDKYRLKELLQALHLSKSSYCYQMNALKRPDKYCKIRTLIREIFDSSKRTYGSESEKK